MVAPKWKLVDKRRLGVAGPLILLMVLPFSFLLFSFDEVARRTR